MTDNLWLIEFNYKELISKHSYWAALSDCMWFSSDLCFPELKEFVRWKLIKFSVIILRSIFNILN